MKTFTDRRERFLSSSLFAFSLLLFLNVACNAAQTGQQTEAPQALKQTVRDKNISINFCRMLEMRHVSRKKFDESISTRGFELYLKAIDPSKIYFMQSDVDEFDAAFARTMAQSAKKGDLTPAYVIYNRFLQRVDERCATARGGRPGRRFGGTRARQRETGFSAAIRPLRTKKRQTKTTRSGSSA